MFSPIELLYGRFVRHERCDPKVNWPSVRTASDRFQGCCRRSVGAVGPFSHRREQSGPLKYLSRYAVVRKDSIRS